MRAPKLRIGVLAGLASALAAGCLVAAASTPVVALDLSAAVPRDSAVTIGTLPNGLTYYVRANGWPEKRVELRLAIRAGSLNEDEDQRGLAHFVEHMAFNGSENFPPGEVVRYFESIGARLGSDLNASTSFDQTVYRLEVPVDGDSLLDRGLLLLADIAARLTFADSEIARERGVVLEEWRGRLGAGERMGRIVLPILYYGSRYADRLPIGDPDIIQSAPPARLRDFYRAWYRPEQMAICVVGDIDTTRVLALVRERLAPLPRREGPSLAPADVPLHPQTLFAIATDPEARVSTVGITFKQSRAPLRTLADYRTSWVRSLIAAMLNERFRELSRIPDAPFLGASASFGTLGPSTRVFSVGATVQEGRIEPGLRALVLELQRVRTHGFGAAEIERARSTLLAGIERAYEERDRTESRALVGQILAHYLDASPMPSIEQRLQLAREFLPGITVEDAHALLAEILAGGSRVVVVQAPEKEGLMTPAEGDLQLVIAAAESMAVTPWFDKVAGKSLLETLPEPGRVRARREIPALGVTVLELSNGVEVWLRSTDFQKDEVLISAHALGGASVVERDRYAAATQAVSIVREAGWGGFSPTEISKLLAGKLVGVSPYVGDYTQGITGSSTPADLETALQLLYLVFTSVSDRPEAVEVVKKQLRALLENRDQDPNLAFLDAVARVNSRDHYMERPLDRESVEALQFEPAVEFYRERFANAADFTFFVVGAFEIATLEPLLERYVASLPSAGGRRSKFRDREYRFPKGIVEEEVRKGLEPQSRTALTFFADPGRDRVERGRLAAANELLEIRLREILREELGSTYSVQVSTDDLQPVPGYGTVSVAFGGAPENRHHMVEETLREIARLQRDGPEESEVATVQEIQRRDLETSEKQNGWWASALRRSHLLGLDPAGILEARARIAALTPAVLRETFVRYFPLQRRTLVTLVPEGSADTDE